MLKQSPSKIIKSGFREVVESPLHKCYTAYKKSHNIPGSVTEHGKLLYIKDEILFASGQRIISCEENLWIILLPLSGSLKLSCNSGPDEIILPDEFKLFYACKDETLCIANPNNSYQINYLHIGIQADSFKKGFRSPVQKVLFKEKNHLCELTLNVLAGQHVRAGIGVYEGRKETTYAIKKPGNAVYVFVVNGAFEVAGRLLEDHDGILLWDTNELEFEALATNSVILLLET